MKKTRKGSFEFLERYVLLRDLSLMKKLVVFSSLLVILPVLSVGIISYQRSAVELEKEVRQASLQVIDQVQLHIEYYVQDFEVTSLKIMKAPELTNFLKFSNAQESENIKRNEGEALRNYLKIQEYSRPDISNITIITKNDEVIDTLGELNYYPASNITEEYWYSSVPYNGMTMLVSRTLKLKDNEVPVLSLVKRIQNPQTFKTEAILIMDINFRRIEEILKKITISNQGYFFILDAKGHYVYHPDYSKLGEKVDIQGITNLKSTISGSALLETDTKDLVTYTHSSRLNWTFFTSVQYESLTKGINLIGKTIIVTIIISLVLAYSIGYGFASSIIRPIRRLQKFMKQVEVGKLDGRLPVGSKDEIGQLTKGFNNTVEKLSRLLDEVYVSKIKEAEMSLKQKESELTVLQSQINPHFLYNSLETIRGMALEENQENIAMMSNALGKLLRYNLRNNSSTVSLREEIKFCEMYLQIQKFRFEDRFDYRFDIPEWAENLKVVKFSLQPIVENCFVHAFGADIKEIMISVSIIRTSVSTFKVRISDTGSGMNEKVLKSIQNKINQNRTTIGGKNIGILNVHHRINYLFGFEYGITIQSEQGAGTDVDLHLPVLLTSEGENHENNFTG